MLWTCSRDGHSGTLQGHWHWVDCRRAAFVRFWVADRSDSWSVLAFGAKWIISGWQPVQYGRPACITTAYLWHNLQLVHRLEDYHGTPIINLHAHTMARLTWGQTAGGTVANSLIGRGHTVTKAGPNGGADVLCLRIDHRVGPLHREIACPGGTQGGLNCLTHAPPRRFPTPKRRRMGTGTFVMAGRRGPLGRRPCWLA